MEAGRSSPFAEEERLLDELSHPALQSPAPRLYTHCAACALAVLHVVYVVLCVLLLLFCWLRDVPRDECVTLLRGLDSRTPLLLGKVLLWMLVFFHHTLLQHQHRGLRRRGHLSFYRSSRAVTHLPLLIHSTGNALVLAVVATAVLLDAAVKNLSAVLLLIIICVELLLSTVCLIIYTACVVRFNCSRALPDVTEDERKHACCVTDTHTGFRDSSQLEDVVEKQADLIHYLKQHNRVLSQKILQLRDGCAHPHGNTST